MAKRTCPIVILAKMTVPWKGSFVATLIVGDIKKKYSTVRYKSHHKDCTCLSNKCFVLIENVYMWGKEQSILSTECFPTSTHSSCVKPLILLGWSWKKNIGHLVLTVCDIPFHFSSYNLHRLGQQPSWICLFHHCTTAAILTFSKALKVIPLNAYRRASSPVIKMGWKQHPSLLFWWNSLSKLHWLNCVILWWLRNPLNDLVFLFRNLKICAQHHGGLSLRWFWKKNRQNFHTAESLTREKCREYLSYGHKVIVGTSDKCLLGSLRDR